MKVNRQALRAALHPHHSDTFVHTDLCLVPGPNTQEMPLSQSLAAEVTRLCVKTRYQEVETSRDLSSVRTAAAEERRSEESLFYFFNKGAPFK